MKTNYSDLPRKIKKGLKRKLFKDLKVWKWKEIKITGIVKCSYSISHNFPDFKGFQITGYNLG